MDVMTQRADIDAAVSGKTVCTIFADAAKKWGDLPALRWKREGDWHSLDWNGYRADVAAVTMALKSALLPTSIAASARKSPATTRRRRSGSRQASYPPHGSPSRA